MFGRRWQEFLFGGSIPLFLTLYSENVSRDSSWVDAKRQDFLIYYYCCLFLYISNLFHCKTSHNHCLVWVFIDWLWDSVVVIFAAKIDYKWRILLICTKILKCLIFSLFRQGHVTQGYLLQLVLFLSTNVLWAHRHRGVVTVTVSSPTTGHKYWAIIYPLSVRTTKRRYFTETFHELF